VPVSLRAARLVPRSLLAVLAVTLPAGSLPAQNGNGGGGAAPRAQASALAGARVDVDGSLGDSAWSRAIWINGFVQRDPVEGTPATMETEVAFLFDEDALYVGARMQSAGRGDIRAVTSRRDNPVNSERILVSLDTYLDRRTAYTFGVTATGVRFEYYHPGDSEYNRDYSFDPIWEAEARMDSAGWTAEMRIPFSQLRFNDRPDQVWGLNLNRYIPSRDEDVYWVLVPRNETGWSSRMGSLEGIRDVRPRRRVELLPYSAANTTLRGNRDLNNPFDDGYNLKARAGGDVKVGLGPGLTLDATINPDFGQVEADPAEVNLSAVPTFFNERRPFFTEGANLLRGNGPAYFYSRRIGEAPRGFASGDYVDRPPVATILGAAKVTGRLASGTSIGLLAALTDQEYARVFDTLAGTESRTRIAPRAGYAVIRAQQEFGSSASTIGGSFTAVHRSMDATSVLASLATRNAVAGGVDWNLRFAGGAYELSGAAGFSRVSGDSSVIASIQGNSAHYFQRPDQDHVTYDPGRTSLTGYFGSLRFARNSGRHWLYSVSLSGESPGFELNDAGRLGAADDVDFQAGLRYRENEPGPVFRNYSVALFTLLGWNFGGVRQYNGLDLELGSTLNNFMNANLSVEVFPRALSDDRTRGGPLMETAGSWNINGGVQSSFSSNTRWRVSGLYGKDDLDGYFYRLTGGLSLRPGSRWEVSADPALSWERNSRQYITQRANGPSGTFGTRYIFGTVTRTTLSAQLRMNYAVNPDLTFEVYAEPFAASGQYRDIGELSRPRTSDLRRYGTDGSTIVQDGQGSFTVTDGADQFTLAPNFNVLSFRSNVVLRWEWRPGSTLFLVWQQNRFANGDPVDRSNFGDLWNTVSAEGDNFFAVKISYWIPVD
jgi:hypothetical protein